MFKDFAVKKSILKNGLSNLKYCNQNIKYVYYVHPQGTFPTILLNFSRNTSYHLDCDTVIFIVLLWSVQKYLFVWRKEYLSYSFSEERCIFQGGGLTSTILCKSIIQYQTLKVQPRKLKKLQRGDRFNMKSKSWNCCISFN